MDYESWMHPGRPEKSSDDSPGRTPGERSETPGKGAKTKKIPAPLQIGPSRQGIDYTRGRGIGQAPWTIIQRPFRPLSHKLPDDGVNHQGQHTPEGGKEGAARATNDDAQGEEEDDINPNELHEVEAHRDGSPRQAAEAIDNSDKHMRELLHDNLQSRKSGCARRQGNPHEGRGDE